MATWKLDSAHSEVKFKVKHLVVSTLSGYFQSFEGTVESEKEDFSDARVSFEADVNSISTNNSQRDGHLKSPDFFNAEEHPKLTFKSTAISKKSGDEYELTGDLTIRGTTKEVKLNVTFNGATKGMDGNPVAGFEITGKINRFDFGLQWNALTETGGLVVSDTVRLEIHAELVKA